LSKSGAIWAGTASGSGAGSISGPDGQGHYTVTLTGVTIPDSAVMLTGGLGYPFHARAGHEVEVPGRSRHGTEDFLSIRQPDGTRAHLPQWTTLPTAGDVPTHAPPRLLLSCPLALRRELDAVLSSSTTALTQGGVDEADRAAGALARADRSVRRRAGDRRDPGPVGARA